MHIIICSFIALQIDIQPGIQTTIFPASSSPKISVQSNYANDVDEKFA